MYVSTLRQKLIFAPEVPNQTLHPPQHTSVHSVSALLSQYVSSDKSVTQNRMNRNFGQAKTQRKLVMTNRTAPIGRTPWCEKKPTRRLRRHLVYQMAPLPHLPSRSMVAGRVLQPDLINRVVPAPVQRLRVLTDKFPNATSKF
jgi:hypothetical protein